MHYLSGESKETQRHLKIGLTYQLLRSRARRRLQLSYGLTPPSSYHEHYDIYHNWCLFLHTKQVDIMPAELMRWYKQSQLFGEPQQ